LALIAQVARNLEKKVHELLESSVLLATAGNPQQGKPAQQLAMSQWMHLSASKRNLPSSKLRLLKCLNVPSSSAQCIQHTQARPASW
jgi:hypothetical protein